MKRLLTLVLVALVGVAGYAALRLVGASLAADVYRERLAELSEDYEALRLRYNEAVKRTAVTELRVEDGQLSVAIRTADGDLQVLSSPYDPSKEIYVDYVVHDGRLWIRRVFDEDTPPGAGMVIDPRFVHVDWADESAFHGKAVYRALGDGRWIVDVTGDGSLGLARSDLPVPTELAPPPPVRSYETIDAEVKSAVGAIEPGEALRIIARELGA